MRAGQDMRHLSIKLMREDLPRASLILAELEAFVPDTRPTLEDEMPEIPGAAFRNRIRRAWGHLDRLLSLFGDLPKPTEEEPVLVVRRDQLIELDEWLSKAWRQCAPCEEAQHKIEDEYRELLQLEQSLQDFSDIDIDLSRLQETHTHLDLRIGSIPAENLARLQEVLALSGHIIVNIAGEGESLRILIAGSRANAETLSDVLHAAAFQALSIPESFHDNPQAVSAELSLRRQELEHERRQWQAKLANWRDSNRRELMRAQQLLNAAEPYVNMRNAARTKGALAAIQGWIPAPKAAAAIKLLQEHLPHPFVPELRKPRSDEQHLVPVPIQHRGLLRPFSALVEQYGVPRFGEFDPTVLFAITFAGMFGMMFGDIGHGAVIVLVGLVLRRKLKSFTYLFVLAGGSSMFFGWMYGSIFGVEHWIHPLWIAPLTDPIYMLTVALGWGVVFLTLGSVIAITNRMMSGDMAAALFGHGGLFAITMYLALLVGIFSLLRGEGFPLISLSIVVVALLLLMTYQWRTSDAPFGERLLTTLIETFEIVNGYIASSLSFLRVAAFSLNHVALSLAIFTLAEGMNPVGHWITLVLGNLFIIVLEGTIVAIQTLRLEYYEGFSRYFFGDGTPFTPLRVGRSQTG